MRDTPFCVFAAALQASNGVVHVINRVLIPPGFSWFSAGEH